MLADTDLLALWERSVGQPSWRRDDLLLAEGSASMSRALGDRNAGLLAAHRAWCGNRLDLHSRCPQCATTLEFAVECEALSAQIGRPAVDAPQQFNSGPYLIQFRLPNWDDVAWAASHCATEAATFEQRLLKRCILDAKANDAATPVSELPEAVLSMLSQRMEALDPGASLAFTLDCPSCGTGWSAPLDIGHALWRKLQVRAEQILLEVDALARHYGWTEPQVLALSPVRRAAYLQMVTA